MCLTSLQALLTLVARLERGAYFEQKVALLSHEEVCTLKVH